MTEGTVMLTALVLMLCLGADVGETSREGVGADEIAAARKAVHTCLATDWTMSQEQVEEKWARLEASITPRMLGILFDDAYITAAAHEGEISDGYVRQASEYLAVAIRLKCGGFVDRSLLLLDTHYGKRSTGYALDYLAAFPDEGVPAVKAYLTDEPRHTELIVKLLQYYAERVPIDDGTSMIDAFLSNKKFIRALDKEERRRFTTYREALPKLADNDADLMTQFALLSESLYDLGPRVSFWIAHADKSRLPAMKAIADQHRKERQAQVDAKYDDKRRIYGLIRYHIGKAIARLAKDASPEESSSSSPDAKKVN